MRGANKEAAKSIVESVKSILSSSSSSTEKFGHDMWLELEGREEKQREYVRACVRASTKRTDP